MNGTSVVNGKGRELMWEFMDTAPGLRLRGGVSKLAWLRKKGGT